MPLQVTVDIPERQRRALTRMLRGIAQGVARVLSRAVKRTTDIVRSRVVKAVAGNINLKQKDLYQRGFSWSPIVQVMKRLGGFFVGGRVIVTGQRIPLMRFGAKQTAAGVSYKISRAGGRQRIREAFLATMPASEHRGVFRRAGPSRLPIIKLFGPSIPHVAESLPEVQTLMRVDAGRILQRETSRYADLMLRRAAARG